MAATLEKRAYEPSLDLSTAGAAFRSGLRDFPYQSDRPYHSHVPNQQSAIEPEASTILDLRWRNRLNRTVEFLNSQSFQDLLSEISPSTLICNESVSQAVSLLRSLPPNFPIPKVCPDEDGDVEFHWAESPSAIITVEKETLQALFGPNSSKSKHLNDVPIVGGRWPREIFSRLTLG